MKKLYIDIDGVLLTLRNTQRPLYAVEFIDFITSEFDCYWLTTHCKEGNTSQLMQYLSPYYDGKTLEKLMSVKPTSWLTAKTEAIDFESDFYWVDDYIFNFEKDVLEKYGKLERWIKVESNNENELKHITEILKSKNAVSKKFIFLDIDGVLNTRQYGNRLMREGLAEFDENGSLFDPKAVDNLRYIIEATDASIVISSSWRFDGMQTMNKLWNDRRLPGKLIGITPHLSTAQFENLETNELYQKHPSGTRGIEIEEWLQLNTNKMLEPYTYAAIDDEDDFLMHQAGHIALTNSETGITREVANRVISILNGI